MSSRASTALGIYIIIFGAGVAGVGVKGLTEGWCDCPDSHVTGYLANFKQTAVHLKDSTEYRVEFDIYDYGISGPTMLGHYKDTYDTPRYWLNGDYITIFLTKGRITETVVNWVDQ